MSVSRKVRVLIVAGESLIRRALNSCFEEWKGHGVCGKTGDAREALALCRRERPDLIVVELPLRHGDGHALLRDLHKQHPDARIVVVAEREDRAAVERAMRAGAPGYTLRGDEDAELREVCEAVLRGERKTSRAVEQAIYGALAGHVRNGGAGDLARLTDQQFAVFEAMGRGLGPKAIAGELGRHVKTVETHESRMKKIFGDLTTEALRTRAKRWRDSRGSGKAR